MSNHEGHEGHEGHEEHEEHEEHEGPRVGIRLNSPLNGREELVMSMTIGAAIAVHRELGPGFLESIYHKAMRVELESRNLAYESERAVRVKYRGVEIPGQRIDLVVERLVVVELEAVKRLDDIHRAQLISYLKTTGLRAGLLINFRVARLAHGLKRIVL